MLLQTTVNPSTRQRHIQLTRATKAQLETMEKQASEARSNVIRRSAGELPWPAGLRSWMWVNSGSLIFSIAF